MPFNNPKVQNIVGVFLVALALVALGFSFHATTEEAKANARLKTYVQCQADWNSFLFNALLQNRDSSNKATQALDDLINSITTAKSSTDTRAALARYQAARAQQKDAQTKNPLPPPPDQICQLEDK